MSAPTIHDRTPRTDDAAAWLAERNPEGDLYVAHTTDCDAQSEGDACVGGCPVVALEE